MYPILKGILLWSHFYIKTPESQTNNVSTNLYWELSQRYEPNNFMNWNCTSQQFSEHVPFSEGSVCSAHISTWLFASFFMSPRADSSLSSLDYGFGAGPGRRTIGTCWLLILGMRCILKAPFVIGVLTFAKLKTQSNKDCYRPFPLALQTPSSKSFLQWTQKSSIEDPRSYTRTIAT